MVVDATDRHRDAGCRGRPRARASTAREIARGMEVEHSRSRPREDVRGAARARCSSWRGAARGAPHLPSPAARDASARTELTAARISRLRVRGHDRGHRPPRDPVERRRAVMEQHAAARATRSTHVPPMVSCCLVQITRHRRGSRATRPTRPFSLQQAITAHNGATCAITRWPTTTRDDVTRARQRRRRDPASHATHAFAPDDSR